MREKKTFIVLFMVSIFMFLTSCVDNPGANLDNSLGFPLENESIADEQMSYEDAEKLYDEYLEELITNINAKYEKDAKEAWEEWQNKNDDYDNIPFKFNEWVLLGKKILDFDNDGVYDLNYRINTKDKDPHFYTWYFESGSTTMMGGFCTIKNGKVVPLLEDDTGEFQEYNGRQVIYPVYSEELSKHIICVTEYKVGGGASQESTYYLMENGELTVLDVLYFLWDGGPMNFSVNDEDVIENEFYKTSDKYTNLKDENYALLSNELDTENDGDKHSFRDIIEYYKNWNLENDKSEYN